MNKGFMNVVKGVAAGMAVGGAVGVMIAGTMKPTPQKKLRDKAVKAIDTIGSVMQNIADMSK